MGKWVVFIGDARLNLNAMRAMTFDGAIERKDYGEKQFDVLFREHYDAYVSFQSDYNGLIMNDYSPEELKTLPWENPQFILVRYSDVKLLEQILSAEDFPKDILIDCDGMNLGFENCIEKSRLLHNSRSDGCML